MVVGTGCLHGLADALNFLSSAFRHKLGFLGEYGFIGCAGAVGPDVVQQINVVAQADSGLAQLAFQIAFFAQRQYIGGNADHGAGFQVFNQGIHMGRAGNEFAQYGAGAG